MVHKTSTKAPKQKKLSRKEILDLSSERNLYELNNLDQDENLSFVHEEEVSEDVFL